MGGEFRRNEFDTNLPEEQATEFEKFDNFTQLLRGLATEADTQFGITDKQFRFNDFNLFLADDWRLSPSLTLNLGVRYEFFGLPKEVNGRIGNVDFEALTNTENPVNAFIVPKNVQNTGFAAIDAAIAASEKADNNHTLKGQDWNNVAPRVGFAWTPSQQLGRARRLRDLLRSAVGGVHQHGVQQLSVPARAGSHVPGERGSAERGVVAAGSELPVQPVPAEPHRADGRRDRHLSDPRRHERDTRSGRHAEPDRSGHGTADARQHRRDVRVPRHRPRSPTRRTSSSTTSASSASWART